MSLLEELERIETAHMDAGHNVKAAGVAALRKAWISGHAPTERVARVLLRHQLQEYTDTTARYEAGEDVVPGDCWRACLASLLEIPLADVPHFIHLYPMLHSPECVTGFTDDPCNCRPLGPQWWLESVAWVQQQRPGWTIAAWDRPEPWTPMYGDAAEGAPSRVILTAPSPRGAWNHSVLVDAQTGELAHDPFPGGQGVLDGPGDRVALVREEWLE